MKFKLALGTIAVLAAFTTSAIAGREKEPTQPLYVAPVSSATSSGDGLGTKLVTIIDPVLNMKADSITIPANWIFEGAVFPGSSCSGGPWFPCSAARTCPCSALPRVMNARSRAADDWCDYSLDLQKRLDPNTGLLTKDSGAYNYTWVNEQGDRFSHPIIV
jgi:hypothetical protein